MPFQITLYKSDYFGSSAKYCESCTKLVTLDCVTIDMISRVILYKICYFEAVQMLWYLESACTKVVILNQSKCCGISSHPVHKLLFWTSPNVVISRVILYKSYSLNQSKCCDILSHLVQTKVVILNQSKSCAILSHLVQKLIKPLQSLWYLESSCTKRIILNQSKCYDNYFEPS